jgi:hypothetical protein
MSHLIIRFCWVCKERVLTTEDIQKDRPCKHCRDKAGIKDVKIRKPKVLKVNPWMARQQAQEVAA